MNMSLGAYWLLPEGVDEVLPPRAAEVETLRRCMVDLFTSWGYELVIPPLIDYLESLLTGVGNDLELRTFKLTDQLSGRLLGVRADMTPQVARIDAHHLKRQVPTRLCYLGSVLHTLPGAFAGSRNPIQVGAELYGHAGIESDVEVLCLMIEALRLAGLDSIYVDVGHMGIFRGLVQEAGLDACQEAMLFDCLQRKAAPELDELFAEWSLTADSRARLRSLVMLNGDDEVIAEARRALQGTGPHVQAALDDLENLAGLMARQAPGVRLHFDLAELRGYHYHTGVMFAAYVPGQGKSLALGGRYDDIGRFFGRARPATGFSLDLKQLVSLANVAAPRPGRIHAPWSEDEALRQAILRLRAQGEAVVCDLPGAEASPEALGCTRRLVRREGEWRIEDV